MLWFTIKITKIETVVEYKLKSQQLMIDKEKELINQYVTENNITVTPTVSGLLYRNKKGKEHHHQKDKLAMYTTRECYWTEPSSTLRLNAANLFPFP